MKCLSEGSVQDGYKHVTLAHPVALGLNKAFVNVSTGGLLRSRLVLQPTRTLHTTLAQIPIKCASAVALSLALCTTRSGSRRMNNVSEELSERTFLMHCAEQLAKHTLSNARECRPVMEFFIS